MQVSTSEKIAALKIPVSEVIRDGRNVPASVLNETIKCLKKYLSEGFSLNSAREFTQTETGVGSNILDRAIASHKTGPRIPPLKRGHYKLTDDALDIARRFEREKKLKNSDSKDRSGQADKQISRALEIIAEEIALTVRISRIVQQKYIDSPEFHKKNAANKIMTPLPEPEVKQRNVKPDKSLPAYIARLYDTPLLTPIQEKHIFRQLNYLRYRMALAAKKLDLENPDMKLLQNLEALNDKIQVIRNKILESNLRLAVNQAKKTTGHDAADDMFDKISDMNISIGKAIDGFDYSKGFKFSTYATWAVKKNYIRVNQSADRHNTRFSNAPSEIAEDTPDKISEEPIFDQSDLDRVNAAIGVAVSERELEIIEMRMGLNEDAKVYTLQDVGKKFGLTKERIRQIELKALGKIRNQLKENNFSNISEESKQTDTQKPIDLYEKYKRLGKNSLKTIALIWHTNGSTEAEIRFSLSNQEKVIKNASIKSLLSTLIRRGFLEHGTTRSGVPIYKLTAQAEELLYLIDKNAA